MTRTVADLARNLERMLAHRKAWPACMALPWKSQRRVAIDERLVRIVSRHKGGDRYDPRNTIRITDAGVRAVQFFRAGRKEA